MSKTVKFTMSDEQYTEFHRRAQEKMLSDQEYIRSILFPEQAKLTPQDAVRKALNKFSAGETFTVPEIYGDAWTVPNGTAGRFGQEFERLVLTYYSTQIQSLKNSAEKRRGCTVYKRL